MHLEVQVNIALDPMPSSLTQRLGH
jgi:hypothetical protein